MTQNPFDALGDGGFDMNALLQQAQQMQQQLEEAQANLARQTVDGTAQASSTAVTPTTCPTSPT
jgi:nucleoid-associated protein EbfC